MTAAILSLDTLNTASTDAFVAALGDIFEHAPWIAAAAAARRPFATVTTLHHAMRSVVAAAPAETIRGFLQGHPDLAGKAAIDGTLTAASTSEQASAGLDRLSAAEHARFLEGNAAYAARFGFPFILCIRRHTKDSALKVLERRLAGNPDAELLAALDEIGRITALRLAERVSGPGPLLVHGELSTHLLDTGMGRPAAGVPVTLFEIVAGSEDRIVARDITDSDGRTANPLIAHRPLPIGRYEMHVDLRDYLVGRYPASLAAPFLDIVHLRFGIAEPEGNYHVPLLFSPWNYTTYRGS